MLHKVVDTLPAAVVSIDSLKTSNIMLVAVDLIAGTHYFLVARSIDGKFAWRRSFQLLDLPAGEQMYLTRACAVKGAYGFGATVYQVESDSDLREVFNETSNC